MQSNNWGEHWPGGPLGLLIAAEWLVRAVARMGIPLVLAGSVGTGLVLMLMEPNAGPYSHGTIRGMHFLAGLAVAVWLLYRLTRLLRRLIREWPGLGGLSLPPLRFYTGVSAKQLAVGAYWTTLSLLLLSGFAKFIKYSHDFFGLPLEPSFGWNVLHVIVTPFFLGILVLLLFLWGGQALSAWRRHLFSP